jgi:hypothetical protein
LGRYATAPRATAGTGQQTSRDQDREGFTEQEGAAVEEAITVEEGGTMNGVPHG